MRVFGAATPNGDDRKPESLRDRNSDSSELIVYSPPVYRRVVPAREEIARFTGLAFLTLCRSTEQGLCLRGGKTVDIYINSYIVNR